MAILPLGMYLFNSYDGFYTTAFQWMRGKLHQYDLRKKILFSGRRYFLNYKDLDMRKSLADYFVTDNSGLYVVMKVDITGCH